MTPHKDDNPSDRSIEALLNAAMGGDAPGRTKDAPKDADKTATGNGTKAETKDTKPEDKDTKPKAKDEKPKDAKPKAKSPDKDGGDTGNGGNGTDGNAAKSFSQMVRERATESDSRPNATTNLRKIINGDMLNTEVVRRQIGVFLLITAFIIVYITNRYACQRDLVKIDKLNKELTNAKFRALSSTSELTEKSRESRVLDLLRLCNDSTLHIASQPPYIIPVPEEDGE